MTEIKHIKTSLLIGLPIVIGVIIFIVVSMFLNLTREETRFEELALGKETKIYRAMYQDVLVHCSELTDGAMCLDGWKQRGGHPVTLWLGNSQLHAINQMKSGDVNSVQLLYDKLTKSDNDLLAFSEPNASLQEHYVLFEYLKSRLPIRTLLLPAVFDDTRENGLRDGLIPALHELPVMDELSKTKIGREILTENKSVKDTGDMAGLNDTPQKVVESAITDWLTEHWSLWDTRSAMRGQLYNSLYLWRNSVFGINAQSKRKIIPGRYVKNLAALKSILQSCAEQKINVILYIVPLRNDVEPPYVTKEYVSFKKDVELLSSEYGAVFADIEGLVPGELWGRKDATSINGEAELDFMHFQAGGHRLLAETMFELLQANHFLSDSQ